MGRPQACQGRSRGALWQEVTLQACFFGECGCGGLPGQAEEDQKYGIHEEEEKANRATTNDQDHQQPAAHRERPGAHTHQARDAATGECHPAPPAAAGAGPSQSQSQSEECTAGASNLEERHFAEQLRPRRDHVTQGSDAQT